VHQRAGERAELSGLSERNLVDFAASRSAVIYEVNKPLWQAK
jgi:uncharacterized protein YjiS (DUF1127 family)